MANSEEEEVAEAEVAEEEKEMAKEAEAKEAAEVEEAVEEGAAEEEEEPAPKKVKKQEPKAKAKAKAAEEEEESDEEPMRVGTLQAPLVVTGARERKKTETYVVEVLEKAEFVVLKGKGKALGKLANVSAMLDSKTGSDDVMQHLYHACFSRKGQKLKVKAALREFSGFPFDASTRDAELAKRTVAIGKRSMDELKQMLKVCCQVSGGSKDELVARLLEFLGKPSDSGISAKVDSAVKRKRATTPKKGSAKKPTKAKPVAKKSEASGKAKKDSAVGIKKPPSALELYLKERLPALKLKNDEVSEADLEKHLKDKWKTLAADKKSKFDDEHKVLLKKYDEAVAKAKAAAANATIVDEEEDGDEDEGDDE
eukprot:CAMPEP_0179873384 /NCGR_PEP_ID=MMETSP0982-20121206/22143_1 /TAXON_ID=483367 /ORGANISM="non described non described, Strain CCMP 2436" /LENGTH=367 /DNA_ID=CAMNT_0021764743 /DNA_START=20 /DNA_END=1123 /DNA_ORIENTATION=+